MKEDLKLKFGMLVELEVTTYKINEAILSELRTTYGECLSDNQLNNLCEDYGERELIIPFEDLTIKHQHNFYGILVGVNKSFGYFYMRYGQYTSFTYGGDTCIDYTSKPIIKITNSGRDFSEYTVQSKPMIKNTTKNSIKSLKEELFLDDFFKPLKELK